MYCVRMTNMFFIMSTENGHVGYRTPIEKLTNAELKNKVCQNDRGRRGNCLKCEVSDMCRIGKELQKRGLLRK